MTDSKKIVNEAISELKGIPSGRAFSELLSIYKVVNDNEADGYASGYDRKKSAGWNGKGADSYGIVGYTHLTLRGAMSMIGSYGTAIVKFKLLGGLKDYIFFDYDNDTIKKLMIEVYGKVMSVRDQLYELTGDQAIAYQYGSYSPSDFGRRAQHEIRKKGHYLRGMVCEYWSAYEDIVVYPFNFGDMVTCAVAKHLTRYMSESEVNSKFVGIMDQKSRDIQDRFLDIVPYMEMLGAADPDGLHYSRVGANETVYVPYETRNKRYNIAIIDDTSWVKPSIQKLFPSDDMLNEMPTNISSSGNFTFIMNGLTWKGNVLGEAEGVQNNGPIFMLKGGGDWFAWSDLEFMYKNPDWVKENLCAKRQTMVAEAFKPGMSYDDFVKNNGAIGYVCSHSWSVDGILNHGFSREWASENDKAQRGGSWYGIGVYGSPMLGSENSYCHMRDAGAIRLSKYGGGQQDGLKYGGIIFKCVILGGWNGFLIFDKNLAQKVYGQDWMVEKQIHKIFGEKDPNAEKYLIDALLRGQSRNGGGYGFKYEVTDDDTRTGQAIQSLFSSGVGSPEYEKWETFFRQHGVRGAVYHGGNDGYAFVCYNFSEVVPIAVSYDNGQTFTTEAHSWSDRSGRYSTQGINWEMLHDRLETGGDPVNKIGHIYKEVARIPKRVECNGYVFGIVNVETKNGKFNLVKTGTWDKVFPIDLDVQPTVGSSGKLRFEYRGYRLMGIIAHEQTGLPAFTFEPYGLDTYFDIKQLDEVIDYYEQQMSQPQENEGGYEEQQDGTTDQQLQEEFFKALDRIERV